MKKEKKEVDERFRKFGTISFTAISKVNDFIGYLEQGQVMGTKCVGCGKIFFPPRADCAGCMGSDMQWFEVTGTRGHIVEGKIAHWQVTLKIGFTLDA